MAIRKIITVPNPLLRQKTKTIAKNFAKGEPASGWDKKIIHLVNDMIETAKAAHDPEGVGLSAIQIGELKRIFVIKKESQFEAFINPEIVWQSTKKFSSVLEKEKLFLEGCLSVPGYFSFVDRPYKIKLRWQNLKAKTKVEYFSGKHSAYVQHELDHLNGILFTDRALKQGNKIYRLEKSKDGEKELVEVEIG